MELFPVPSSRSRSSFRSAFQFPVLDTYIQGVDGGVDDHSLAGKGKSGISVASDGRRAAGRPGSRVRTGVDTGGGAPRLGGSEHAADFPMHPDGLVIAGFVVLVLLCVVTVAVARQIERSRPPEDPMALLLAAPSPRPRRRRRISPAMAQRLAAAGYFDSMPPGLSLAHLVAPPPDSMRTRAAVRPPTLTPPRPTVRPPTPMPTRPGVHPPTPTPARPAVHPPTLTPERPSATPPGPAARPPAPTPPRPPVRE